MPDLRKAAFTFITIVVVPLLFFSVLELGLRVAGVGNSFEYLQKIDIDGQPHFQENPDFADQFYAASLDINPRENTFTVDRPPELTRIFILGGSAALGFPHKNHGFDRLLETQLRAALPARRIEVINMAMTSVNSHVMYAVAKSLPANSADFAVILMGNNEVVGPYGPGTLNQNFLGSITAIRALQALKRTRIWQALNALNQQIRPTNAMQDLKWEGMQMFTSHGVPQDDPRMAGVYSHYEQNLADIIDTLGRKGMHVLLSSVPVNVRDSAPFLSVHDPGLTNEQLDQWREETHRGAQSADEKDWGKSAAHFKAALEMDPGYADTHFRLATALENLGESGEARMHYEHALDLDALRFRADTRINQIIRKVATGKARDTLSFVDSASAFERASQPLQPGWNLFLEHVHYDFAGNNILAAEIARSIVGTVTAADDYEPLPDAEVARRTGFPNHDTPGEIRTLQSMVEHPPFPGQSNYTELVAFLKNKQDRVKREIGSPADVIQKRQNLVESGLADWKIYFELAVLNQRLRHSSAMYDSLERALDAYPHNRETYMKIAEAMSRDGRWREAIPYLERSLYYTRGDERKIAETINWLGTAYLRTGEYDQAASLLLEVTNKYSDQIDLTLMAYGNLVRYSREQGNRKELDRHIADAQRYARSLVRDGKDKEFPLLYQRMSQIMSMGGFEAEAGEWAQAQPR